MILSSTLCSRLPVCFAFVLFSHNVSPSMSCLATQRQWRALPCLSPPRGWLSCRGACLQEEAMRQQNHKDEAGNRRESDGICAKLNRKRYWLPSCAGGHSLKALRARCRLSRGHCHTHTQHAQQVRTRVNLRERTPDPIRTTVLKFSRREETKSS